MDIPSFTVILNSLLLTRIFHSCLVQLGTTGKPNSNAFESDFVEITAQRMRNRRNYNANLDRADNSASADQQRTVLAEPIIRSGKFVFEHYSISEGKDAPNLRCS